jgi:hypothetical protein
VAFVLTPLIYLLVEPDMSVNEKEGWEPELYKKNE